MYINNFRKFSKINIKRIFEIIIRIFGIGLFVFLSIIISKADWFGSSLGKAIFLITIITSIFLVVHMLYFIIELIGFLDYFNQRNYNNYISILPSNLLIEKDDFFYIKDTIVITKLSKIITIKYDKLMTFYTSSLAILSLIWIFSVSGVLLYIGLFIGVFEINFYNFSFDLLVIFEIIWLFTEFIFPSNNFITPLINGLRFSNESIILQINTEDKTLKISSKSIKSLIPEKKLNIDLSTVKNFMIKPLNTLSSDVVAITLPNKYVDHRNLSPYLFNKGSTTDLVLLIVPNNNLANQIISMINSIS